MDQLTLFVEGIHLDIPIGALLVVVVKDLGDIVYKPLGQPSIDFNIYDPTSTTMPADVSYVDPNINTPQPDPLSAFLTDSQNAAIRQLPVDFPAVLAQAKVDYYTFKAGVDAGLFSVTGDTTGIVEWFSNFPRYWQAIRPNYESQPDVLTDGDNFAAMLGSDISINPGLGIGPLVIAGILVAAIAGVAGVIWAVGYVKSQNNISSIIQQTVAGKLPPSVLAQVEQNAGSSSIGSIFGNVGTIVKWGAIGLAAWFVLPVLTGLFKGGKAANA